MASNNSFSATILGLWSSSKSNSPLEGLPIELVCMIAEYLPSNDLASLSLTSRKIHEDVRPVFFKNVTVDMHSMHPKLALLRRFVREKQELFNHLRSLDLRFIALHPANYRPKPTTVAMIVRAGAKYPVRSLGREERRTMYGMEDMHLEWILQNSGSLHHLNLEILGDLLPVMQVDHGFQNLKTLHLGRFPHSYRAGVPDNHLASGRISMSLQELLWIFELPKLNTLSLHQFGDIGDVGRILSSRRHTFRIKKLVMKETSFALEDVCSVREALAHFFAAFESLSTVEWYLQRHRRMNLHHAKGIVAGLASHRSTLQHLLLRENNVVTRRYYASIYSDALPMNHHWSNRPGGVNLFHFWALESLTIMGESLVDSDWNPEEREFSNNTEADNVVSKLPKSLRRLTIAEHAGVMEPALYLTAAIILQGRSPHQLATMPDVPHFSRPDLDVSCTLLPAMSRFRRPRPPRNSNSVPDFIDESEIESAHGRVPTMWDSQKTIRETCRDLVNSFCAEMRARRIAEAMDADEDVYFETGGYAQQP